MQNNSIFRKESLERLSSPERLDQLMQVVKPRDWLPLSTLGVFVFIGLVWSIVGRIPITENAMGVLIHPRNVLQVQSPIAGQLQSVNIKEGECVKKNQVLATIDPTELKQQLEQQRVKYSQLAVQTQDTAGLQQQRSRLEKEVLASEQANLQKRLQAAMELTPILKELDMNSIAQQRESLETRLRNSQALTPVLKAKSSHALKIQRASIIQRLRDAQTSAISQQERLEKRRELSQEGVISRDAFLQVEQEYRQALQQVSQLQAEIKQIDVRESETEQQYLSNLATISEVQVQLKELSTREIQAQQKYIDNINNIAQLQTQLQDINTKRKRLEQENLETTNNKFNQIEELKRNIAQLEQKVAENSKILSASSGCILEITATSGQVVNPGAAVATINTQGQAGGKLLAVTYFPVKQGKKIKPGMPIQITPDTVQRERFGGITGKVVSVSSFPITTQGATLVLGSSELVNTLVSGEPKLQIVAELDVDSSTSSGYKWSSSGGSDMQISSGTTSQARVQVEQRAPITFVFPFLKEWTGMS
jgi:HlyD family secretion protein